LGDFRNLIKLINKINPMAQEKEEKVDDEEKVFVQFRFSRI